MQNMEPLQLGPQSPQHRFCVTCGHHLGGTASFCPNCGQRIDGSTNQLPTLAKQPVPPKTSGVSDIRLIGQVALGFAALMVILMILDLMNPSPESSSNAPIALELVGFLGAISYLAGWLVFVIYAFRACYGIKSAARALSITASVLIFITVAELLMQMVSGGGSIDALDVIDIGIPTAFTIWVNGLLKAGSQ